MFYIILIIWVILDLYTKYLASIYLTEKIDIFWDFIFFNYVENTWIAFSIPMPLILLKIITIILIFWIFYYYFKVELKKKNKLIDISIWLILAWAVWNWIERIFNGKVIDFIWVNYFAIFNLADIFIFIWACLYIFSSLYYKK